MTRREQGSRIVYQESRRGLSFVLFLGSLALLGLASVFQSGGMPAFTWTFVGASLFVSALAVGRLLKAEFVVIDREAGTLTVVRRRPPLPSMRQSFPLERLEERVENRFILQEHAGRYGGVTTRTGVARQDVYVVFDGHQRVIVERDQPAPDGMTFALRLAGEIGCRLAG